MNAQLNELVIVYSKIVKTNIKCYIYNCCGIINFTDLSIKEVYIATQIMLFSMYDY